MVNDWAGFTDTWNPIDSPLLLLGADAYPLISPLASSATVSPAAGICHPDEPASWFSVTTGFTAAPAPTARTTTTATAEATSSAAATSGAARLPSHRPR